MQEQLKKEKTKEMNEESLRDWFGKSKSKDGKGGWVNVVTGGTCASDEPGEGTPKCVSSAKRASMTKAERLSAARRKKAADPGQQSKTGAAKPTYVSTDKPKKKKKKSVKEDWSNKYKKSIDCDNPKGFSQRAHCQGRIKKMNEESDVKGKGSGKKDACYNKVKARYSVWPSAYASGALVKCRKAGAKNWGNKSEEFFPEDHKEIASGKIKDEEGYMARVEFDQIERAVAMLRKSIKKGDQQIPAWVQSKITRAADFIDTAAEYMQSDEDVSEAVKIIQSRGQMYTIMISFMAKTYTLKIYFPTATQPTEQEVNDAVQKVYPGGKVLAHYPCVTSANSGYIVANEQMLPPIDPEGHKNAQKTQKLYNKGSRTDNPNEKKEFLKRTGPQLPLAKKNSETQVAHYEMDGEDIQENTTLDTPEKRRKNYLLNIGVIGEGAAWTRREGKNKKGGLNEKGRKSYERENPGSDLKAPSKKVGNPRRASFCARMKGMKSKLTSKKTASDPNSRINKSLRAWNC